MFWGNIVSALFISLGVASEYDAYKDICLDQVDQEKIEQKGLALLSEANFFVAPSGEQLMNCEKRIFALTIIANPQAKTPELDEAIKTIGYQSTFSYEAAQTLLNFLNRNFEKRIPHVPSDEDSTGSTFYFSDSYSLEQKAAQAFYFLHDRFNQFEPHTKFYLLPSTVKTLQNYFLKEKDPIIKSQMIQVLQKVGFAIKFLYDKQKQDVKQQCHRMAEVYIPMLINALKKRTNESDGIELVVALENWSYPKAYSVRALRLLKSWYESETDDYLKERAREIPELAQSLAK